jgi:hypothetical protein
MCDKEKGTCMFVDVAISGDRNMINPYPANVKYRVSS